MPRSPSTGPKARIIPAQAVGLGWYESGLRPVCMSNLQRPAVAGRPRTGGDPRLPSAWVVGAARVVLHTQPYSNDGDKQAPVKGSITITIRSRIGNTS